MSSVDTRFVATAFPSGRVLLTTQAVLSVEQQAQVVEAFKTWRVTPDGLLVIPDCGFVLARSVKLDLDGSRMIGG